MPPVYPLTEIGHQHNQQPFLPQNFCKPKKTAVCSARPEFQSIALYDKNLHEPKCIGVSQYAKSEVIKAMHLQVDVPIEDR